MTRISLFALVLAAKSAGAATAIPTACIAFEQYPITDTFRGPFARPNLKQSAQVHRFRTAIREGADGVPYFAGRFRVVQWGCGANCHAFALVDKKSGQVFLVPNTATLGATYRVGSALFEIDPPEMIEESGSPLFATISFAWNEKSASLIQLPDCDGYAQPTNPPGLSRQVAPGR